jgi:hypothetical protein
LAPYSISRVCVRLLNLLVLIRIDYLHGIVVRHLERTLFVKHIMIFRKINYVFLLITLNKAKYV